MVELSNFRIWVHLFVKKIIELLYHYVSTDLLSARGSLARLPKLFNESLGFRDLSAGMSLTKIEPKSTPQVERSLNRQVVLEEDEYTEALSHIIARDFFPSQTPSRTNGEPERKRARYDKDLSLDTFQARYTSEDNSSFTQILDEENRVRKEKWAWAWDAQKRVERQQDKMIERRENMLIEPPSVVGVKEKFAIELPKPAGLITEGLDSDKTEQETEATLESLPLVPATGNVSKDTASHDVMAPQKDTRSAGVDGWKFRV